MKIKPNPNIMIKSFLGIFFLSALVLFLICINLFVFTSWNWIQPTIIGLFLLISIFFLILTLKCFYYVLENKRMVVVRFNKEMFYYFSDIVYIDEKSLEKKKTIMFVTNKGHVRYLPNDKDNIVLSTMLDKCQNLIKDKEEIKRKYPCAKI